MPPLAARRVLALCAVAVQVVAGLVVHGMLPDSAATDIAGDALYTGAVYAGIVLLLPRLGPARSGALAAAWCVAVELFQLTGLPIALSQTFPPAVLALGTVFDARDLAIYVVAAACAAALDSAVRSGRSRADLPRRSRPPSMGA